MLPNLTWSNYRRLNLNHLWHGQCHARLAWHVVADGARLQRRMRAVLAMTCAWVSIVRVSIHLCFDGANVCDRGFDAWCRQLKTLWYRHVHVSLSYKQTPLKIAPRRMACKTNELARRQTDRQTIRRDARCAHANYPQAVYRPSLNKLTSHWNALLCASIYRCIYISNAATVDRFLFPPSSATFDCVHGSSVAISLKETMAADRSCRKSNSS